MKSIYYIIALLLISHIVPAQTVSDTLNLDQVEVIKTFDAKLAETQPLDLEPRIEKPQPTEKSYYYKITITPISIDYPVPSLRPLAMGVDPRKNVNNLYAKLGYGTKESAYADLSFQFLMDDLLDFNIYSSYRRYVDEKEIWNAGTSLFNLGARITYRLFENTQLNSNVDINLDEYESKYRSRGQERNVTKIEAGISFENIEKTKFGLGYNFGLSTNIIKFKSEYLKEYGFHGHIYIDKKINDDFIAHIKTDYKSITDGNQDQQVIQSLSLNPGIKYANSVFNASLSGDFVFVDGKLSPFIDASYDMPIYEDLIQVYAGLDQELIRNSTYNLYNNLKLIEASYISNINHTILKKGYAGIRSQFSKNLNFDAQFGYMDIKNLARYDMIIMNRPPSNNYVTDIEYIDGQNFFVQGNIVYQPTDIIEVGGSIVQNFIGLDDEESSLNRPNFLSTLYCTIGLLDDDLTIKPSLRFGNMQSNLRFKKAFSYVDTEINYQPLKQFGFWLNVDNILDDRNQSKFYHPIQGRYIQGGITVTF